ncbi:DUF58 domain-containing protein [Halovenus rubra]|uniref:DUF58 domain-containing protein n=2 Tax=Halovenus rubra TaxID=869890 RepID=A0ABD5X013_9EURY|nr:DUF58 domain-containing protein [Halovenus rubra]
MNRTRVPRWNVGLLATLALAAVGLLYANATLLGATLIPLSYVLYGAVSTLPAKRQLTVERSVGSATPAPGTPVDVTLTVENESENVLPDVRLIDGVPDELIVTEGSPRLCTSLSPGERRTISYSVISRRGTYTFDDPVVRLRSMAGSDRETTEIDVNGRDTVVCLSPLKTRPRETQTTRHTGTVTTDSGGSGLEFHSTRQYRQGDPVNRIDWHHVAKTGEFITVRYREQKTSRTVLIVDARPVNRVTQQPGYPTAVDRSVYAAERLYDTLTEAGIDTTIAAVGLTSTETANLEPDPAGIVWAGSGKATTPDALFTALNRASTRTEQQSPVPPRTDLISSQPQTEPSAQSAGNPGTAATQPSARTDGGDERMRLLNQIPPDASVMVCSPFVDNWPLALCRAVTGEHDLVAVSPDPVNGDSTGQRVVGVQRRLRLRTLQGLGTSTVDWPIKQPFDTALRAALPGLRTHR